MPATIIRCVDCDTPVGEGSSGWLRCPICDAAYCSTCPAGHRVAEHGECDSTKACTMCGYTCLVEV